MMNSEYICTDCGKQIFGTISASFHAHANGHSVEIVTEKNTNIVLKEQEK